MGYISTKNGKIYLLDAHFSKPMSRKTMSNFHEPGLDTK